MVERRVLWYKMAIAVLVTRVKWASARNQRFFTLFSLQ